MRWHVHSVMQGVTGSQQHLLHFIAIVRICPFPRVTPSATLHHPVKCLQIYNNNTTLHSHNIKIVQWELKKSDGLHRMQSLSHYIVTS